MAIGLDVNDLTHVINYGLPDDTENYTHRSGRTGRAGKKGTSISIVHIREKGKIRIIEKAIQKQFERGTQPSGGHRPDKPCHEGHAGGSGQDRPDGEFYLRGSGDRAGSGCHQVHEARSDSKGGAKRPYFY